MGVDVVDGVRGEGVSGVVRDVGLEGTGGDSMQEMRDSVQARRAFHPASWMQRTIPHHTDSDKGWTLTPPTHLDR